MEVVNVLGLVGMGTGPKHKPSRNALMSNSVHQRLQRSPKGDAESNDPSL